MADFKNRALLLRRGIRTFSEQISLENASEYAGFQIANAVVSYLILVFVLTMIFTILCWPVLWKLIFEILPVLIIIIVISNVTIVIIFLISNIEIIKFIEPFNIIHRR